MFTVSNPPGFAKYSDVVLQDNGGAPSIWHISITEYFVFASICVLAAACVATFGVACFASWIRANERGMFVLLPSGVRCKLDDIGFLKILHGSGLDPVTY